MSGNFEALLQELNDEVATMAKALPAEGSEDDEKIQAAAAEGEEDHEEPDGDEDEEGPGDGDGDEMPARPMAKSMTAVIDGQEQEVIDGTELVKSLMEQVEQLGGKLSNSEATLQKALTETLSVVKAQGELIKSLSTKVSALSSAGRGRKSSVTVHERPAGATAPAPAAHAPGDVMAKSLAAQAAGKLTLGEVARVESYLNMGLPVPAEILQRI